MAVVTTPGVHIYQILPHYTTREALDAGFLVLDNQAHERPDWYEYWPITRYLRDNALDERDFYGFLSPRFKEKTNLSSAAVHAFVREHSEADVIILTPSLQLTACHWNVFHYGEFVHPGLIDVSNAFFERIGEPTDLDELVTHSGNEIHSNYMIAKPRFWRAWLAVARQLMDIAESVDDPLGKRLREPTTYRGKTDVAMKIFLLERIPTWLLARDASFVATTRDPFAVRSRLYKVPVALCCDALKVAYLVSGRRGQYRDVFRFMSAAARWTNTIIRVGNFLGVRAIRTCLSRLATYWKSAGRA